MVIWQPTRFGAGSAAGKPMMLWKMSLPVPLWICLVLRIRVGYDASLHIVTMLSLSSLPAIKQSIHLGSSHLLICCSVEFGYVGHRPCRVVPAPGSLLDKSAKSLGLLAIGCWSTCATNKASPLLLCILLSERPTLLLCPTNVELRVSNSESDSVVVTSPSRYRVISYKLYYHLCKGYTISLDYPILHCTPSLMNLFPISKVNLTGLSVIPKSSINWLKDTFRQVAWSLMFD